MLHARMYTTRMCNNAAGVRDTTFNKFMLVVVVFAKIPFPIFTKENDEQRHAFLHRDRLLDISASVPDIFAD